MSRRTIGSLQVLSLGVVCLIASGVLLASPVAALAQTSRPTTRPANPGDNNGRPGARGNAENMFKMIRSRMDDLKLTDEQKTKIDALFDKAIEEAKALEADATLQMQEKFPKIMQRMEQFKQDVKNILDDKQKELFDKTMPAGGGRPGGGAGGGGGPQELAKRFEEVLGRLDLTPEQKEKTAKALEDLRTKITELSEQFRANGPSDDLRQKAATMMGDFREKILGILNDEQKNRFHELMVQERPGAPGGVVGPGGTVAPRGALQPAAAPPATQATP